MRSATRFAVAIIAVCLVATTSATAAHPEVWTKAWAKYQVEKHLKGFASCAPVGAKTRSGGVVYYGEFVCGLSFSNGALFSLTIVPKSQASYALVADKQIAAGSSSIPSVTVPAVTVPTYTPPPVPTSCPYGDYVNAYGQCIPGPSTSPTLLPGGPTAVCADGTYSYSQTAQGTCSYHGGVSVWIRYP